METDPDEEPQFMRESTSAAGLRIFGDFAPEDISQLLGCSPNESYLKGESRTFKSGRVLTRKTSMWGLNAPDGKGDLDGQISWILSQVTDDLAIWSHLSQNHSIDIFCGFFMGDFGTGFALQVETMAALASRKLVVEICLYRPIDDDPES